VLQTEHVRLSVVFTALAGVPPALLSWPTVPELTVVYLAPDAANSSSFRHCSQFNFVGTSTTTLKISEYDEPNHACPVMQKGRLLACSLKTLKLWGRKSSVLRKGRFSGPEQKKQT
jgi:hypothetical protein